MKEPNKIPLNEQSPRSKKVKHIPMPPIKHLYDDFGYVTSIWDITGQDNDDTYTSSDLETLNNNLDKNNNEDSENSN
jgi:hypothetical protein